MSSHLLLDHTGDIGFEVRAGTPEALHEEAARALFDVIVDDLGTVRTDVRVPFRVDGAVDREDLLVRFLSELLFIHDARGWLFGGAVVEEIGRDRIVAQGIGEPFDPSRHRIARQVKAVTYHGLRVERDGADWVARVVLDL